MLRALEPEYDSLSIDDNKRLVVELRNELSETLLDPYPDNTNITYWEGVGNGIYAEFYDLGADAAGDYDYSVEGMMDSIRNPDQYVGTEILPLVSYYYQKNISILMVDSDGWVEIERSGDEYPEDIYIVAINKNHYELLGVIEENTLILIFPTEHPFPTAVRGFKLYRHIQSQLKTIYNKYQSLLEQGVEDQAIFDHLNKLIDSGKDLYNSSFEYMVLLAEGKTVLDDMRPEEVLTTIHDQISELSTEASGSIQ